MSKIIDNNTMENLCIMVVVAATFKFLMEGVSFTVSGHEISFGHVDSMAYGMFLAPILGVHGYVQGKNKLQKQKVDNPDEN